MLALLPFFEPQGLSFVPQIDALYTAAMGAAFLLVLFVYVRGGEYSRLFLLLALFRAALLIGSLISSHTVDKAWVSRTVVILGIVMAAEIGLRYDAMAAVEGIFAILFANITINLVTVFMGGLLRHQTQLYYWSGIRTRFTDSVIPAMALAFLISYKRWKRLFTPLSLATAAIGMAQLLMHRVVTGILACFLLLLVTAVFAKKWGRVPPAVLVFGPIALNLLIVLVRIQSLLSFILVDIMHKSMTFNGRIQIWDQALGKFWNAPLLGAGEVGNGGVARVPWSTWLIPAHNTVVQLLYDGGLVAAVIWLAVFALCARELRRFRGSAASFVIAVGLMALGFEMMMETAHYFSYFYILPVLAANLKLLEEQRERRAICLYVS